MTNRRPHFAPFYAAVFLCAFSGHLFAQEKSLVIAPLSGEHCTDPSPGHEFSDENKRYWFPRVPPYVGYSKGERTTAGGDGTCYIGFPNVDRKSALVMVNGEIYTIHPDKSANSKVDKYKTEDGVVQVEIRVTGGDSTCTPGADSCCGEYTYATLTVKMHGKSQSIKVANYVGG